MKKRNDRTSIYKTYNQDQPMLLPPKLYELIAPNHPVRVVNEVIDQLDIQPLINKFKAGGTGSFNPRMLPKILLLAYSNNISSTRKIEEDVALNIPLMRLV